MNDVLIVLVFLRIGRQAFWIHNRSQPPSKSTIGWARFRGLPQDISPPEGQHPVADSKSTRALATASTTGGQRWVESNGEGRGKGWALQNHRSQTAKCYFWSEDSNAEVARKCVKTKCAFMPWEKRPDEVRLPETLSSYRTGPKDLRSHTWKQLLEATSHTGNLLACVCVH